MKYLNRASSLSDNLLTTSLLVRHRISYWYRIWHRKYLRYPPSLKGDFVSQERTFLLPCTSCLERYPKRKIRQAFRLLAVTNAISNKKSHVAAIINSAFKAECTKSVTLSSTVISNI